MKVLLVYPEFPISFWGFQHGMPLVDKGASLPPLGLITLATLLPEQWDLKLVDLNIEQLDDADILWSDAVFVGGMRVQMPSMHQVIQRAHDLNRVAVVGGPAPTTSPTEFAHADIIFQGEAEGRIDSLVDALKATLTGAPVGEAQRAGTGEPVGETQRAGKPQCTAEPSPANRAGGALLEPPTNNRWPQVNQLPAPRFDLLRIDRYTSMAVQYSRGCPFNCEFCDIIEIYGRKPRVKTPSQVLGELQELYRQGYRGSVFFVDDNFIGNRASVKKMLPELTQWQKAHGYPFEFYTEASVNLAADKSLVGGMVKAGFSAVFLGIETPSSDALKEAGKKQNLAFDLKQSVESLTSAGIEVMGGFIVGFDSDGPEVFEVQHQFIANLPIPLAMIGLLTALPGTALWRRMEREQRLRTTSDGSNFGRPNFDPAMDEERLLRGYADLVAELYTPDAYFDRCEKFVATAPGLPGNKRPSTRQLGTLLRTMWHVGIRSPYRNRFWKLIANSLRHGGHNLAWAVGHAVMGYHAVRYVSENVLPNMAQAVAQLEEERQAGAAAEQADAAEPTQARAVLPTLPPELWANTEPAAAAAPGQ